ncbi:Glycosyltransferase involved in cell wall bisynthesis [Maribacter sedimenticola]|uniref:Glycosyltransferase involved in cell wall bisynthesis n=1 Tax=Maribacter sedimenticola TaxID=228956 RepID=A0ABY1SJX5_9FLAO|nr:glycosyltransferase family 4 protein [Maribacter sedimenticola]SNR67038.1 Glycosyltransferase involved in cell wall bisynthesis [Maribacter sedimenticola]
MKIIYFYQYFTTPKGSWSTRVYEFTKNWVEEGHEVTVVTSIYSKSDLQATKLIENQLIDGINLKIINVVIDNKQPIWKRLYTFIVYMSFSTYYALKFKYDIIICSSGPITVGFPGLIAKMFKKTNLIFEVRDLWPEAPIELGIIKNRFVAKFSYWFEKKCYQKSSLVVALSPGMRDNILERYPKTNVISVTNSANIDLFSEPKKPLSLKALTNKKFAIYTGNIGMVNNSELLFRAALKLKELDRTDIVIVLIGDGKLKEDLKSKSSNLENILFLDLMPKNELVNYVKNAFTSLIPLKNTPMLATSSPNKLFESMAASVPVIQTTNGWIKQMLHETRTGFTVSPDNEDELVEKLIYLADNEIVVKEMGDKAYEYAKYNFDKNQLAKKMITAIENTFTSN